MTRAVILMLDSFGIGATDDAERFGDVGANTLGSIAKHRQSVTGNPLQLPNLARLGLLHAAKDSAGQFPAGCDAAVEVVGAYGFAAELSSGKDTPSGHWELAGVPVLFDWGYFTRKTDTFPKALLDALIQQADLPGVLANCHSSGTVIIDKLGEEHMQSGKPIVYT
ncbi:MAG TPA: phosphopentomutase, partial [Woeseiaceae bacterium]